MPDLANDVIRGAAALAEELVRQPVTKVSPQGLSPARSPRASDMARGEQITTTRSALRQHYAMKQEAAMAKAATATST